jgi:tRNA-modifying protein YgfZ
MLKPVENARRQTRLVDMGVVRVQGADAVKFLQGQLSNDVERLTADHSVLAGLHNPQGRAIALLRLVLAGPEEILALVPRELAATVAARLSKFVLRAKAKISDVSAEWEVAGIVESGGTAAGLTAASVGAARRDGEGRHWVCVATDHGGIAAGSPSGRATTSRWLVVTKSGSPSAAPREDGVWQALDIADGIPQVYAVTSEAFVAQMLNLDLLDGIAFDKGCYTGQEVIARAHYRGKVKRRMQRFRTSKPAKLSAGDSGTLGDGRAFKVVNAVQLSDGRSEFLAVTTFAGTGSDDATEVPAPPTAENLPVHAEQLPLPYSLPA